jgi:hypothetical protein
VIECAGRKRTHQAEPPAAVHHANPALRQRSAYRESPMSCCNANDTVRTLREGR